jgi:hypothetical protein
MYNDEMIENFKDELTEKIEEYIENEIKNSYFFVRIDSLESKVGIKIVPDPDCDNTLKILNIEKNYGLSINFDTTNKEIKGYSLVESPIYKKIFFEIKNNIIPALNLN